MSTNEQQQKTPSSGVKVSNKEIEWRKELIPELREWNCNKLADLLAEEIVLFQDVDRALAGGLAA